MAGRIRTIKPEIIEDALTAGLSHAAFRLFVGALVLADDHGNLRAGAAYLIGQVFHTRAIPDGVTIEDLIAELVNVPAESDHGLWIVYTSKGQRYVHINGWHKHQRIDNALAPRVPLPPGWECIEETRTEGSRKRVRWVSREVDRPSSVGAAPSAPMVVMVPPQLPPVGLLVRPDPDHRSPITDPDRDHEAGAAPPPPPALTPVVRALPGQDLALAALQEARARLWPTREDTALVDAAFRACGKITRDHRDPDVARLSREAIDYVDELVGGNKIPHEGERLARFVRKFGWLLDARAVEAKTRAPPGRVTGAELDEVKQRQRRLAREEQEKAAEASRRAPRLAPASVADVIAKLGKPAKGAA